MYESETKNDLKNEIKEILHILGIEETLHYVIEEFRKAKSTRVPSAQAKARSDYLDLVLGKLPEIAESQRGGTRSKFYPESSHLISEASTMDKTELPEVVDVDKEEEEEPFWDWQAKQLAYLKLPVFYQTTMRSFSTERNKKKKQRVIEIKDDESSEDDKMNRSA
jgi:hypothetical protein